MNNYSIDYIIQDEIEGLKAENFSPKLNKQNNNKIESSITKEESSQINNSMEVIDKESQNQVADQMFNPDIEQVRKSGEIIIEEGERIENIIKKYIDNYNNLLETLISSLKDLNHEQIGAIAHLSGSILILNCLMTIIIALFGDKILKYFRLEEKYPKLANYFKIRQQILNINLIINFLIIISVLIVIIYLNLVILLN